jgi:xanthine/CO dehydrogenase XdhC/CoxF family maturation factor
MGGDDKLLRHVDGVALIRRTALHALATGQDVVVTLRPEDSARRAALAGLALYILSVDDAAMGLSASLRRAASAAGPDTALMVLPADMPEVNAADLTFLHDHDTDAAIIAAALRGPAWYVGALGSRRTAAQRLRVLQDSGLDRKLLARLHALVGLVPATRDSRGLAISVLAEVLALELAAQDGGNVAPPATKALGLPRADGQAGHETP